MICVGLIFVILTCGNANIVSNNGEAFTNIDNVYTHWSHYNDFAKIHMRKRETVLASLNNPGGESKKLLVKVNSEPESQPPVGLSEGGAVNINLSTNNISSEIPKTPESSSEKNTNITNAKVQNSSAPTEITKITEFKNITKANENVTKIPQNMTVVATNATKVVEPDNLLQINSPGVLKRGLIVFGGFAVLALAYFIFYRKKNNKYDSNSTHNANDANQFRYGVLQSEDRRDNLELSRIPLTMESDDDDEEEDLEIFDLEQKKKSLSYVNLQVNDEDIVLNSSKDESKNNLLLDIEDGSSDTLINWSSSGNKSIL